MKGERNTMKVFYVSKKNGRLVCGPFRKQEDAERAAQNYSGGIYGECHVVWREAKA